MRKHLSHIAVAVFTAALAVACANNAPNNERRVQSGGDRGTNDRVTLNGCVVPAPGDSYELRGVTAAAPAPTPRPKRVSGGRPPTPRQNQSPPCRRRPARRSSSAARGSGSPPATTN